jgi:hypothetical protein
MPCGLEDGGDKTLRNTYKSLELHNLKTKTNVLTAVRT